MRKLIITENGASNKPIAILTENSDSVLVDNTIQMLNDNPGKYTVEMIQSFTYSLRCEKCFHFSFGAYMALMSNDGADVKPKTVFDGIMQTFGGFSSMEHDFEESEKEDEEKRENDFESFI